jgi:type I restriction enzyme S subunit
MFMAESYEGYKLCYPGDLVVNSIWAWMKALGFSEYHGIVSTVYSVYRLRDSRAFNYRYLDYLLRSDLYSGEYLVRSKGVWTSRLRLADDDFFNIPILAPPRAEQDAIVAFLDEKLADIDRYIAAKQRLIELLDEQKAAIINQAVTRGLVTKDTIKASIDWLGHIPEDWIELPLKRVTISMCDGPFGSSMKSQHYAETGVRLIRLQNIGVAEFRDDDKAFITEGHFASLPGHDARAGDLLLAGLGDPNNPVGRACIIPDFINIAMVKADCFRLRLNQEFLSHKYAMYYLSSASARIEVSKHIRGATRERINLTGAGELMVPIPPLDEQERICEFIEEETKTFKEAIANANGEIELMQELRTTLIAEAVTGKIDVRKQG